MKFSIFKPKSIREIRELSKFIRDVISNTPYYSAAGKKFETEIYTQTGLKKISKEKDQLVCVCMHRGRIVGFSHGKYDCGTFWGNWIGVDKDYRGRGVASGLISFREKILAKQGVHKVWCDTHHLNKEAQHLFKKLGYKKITKLSNHWYNDTFYLWEKGLVG